MLEKEEKFHNSKRIINSIQRKVKKMIIVNNAFGTNISDANSEQKI
jgi:hypothetical protein